jgi:TatD DNase family protein
MFRGVYHGTTAHSPDLHTILKRATSVGLKGILSTSTNLRDYHENVKLINQLSNEEMNIKTTLGVHPTSCGQVAKEHDISQYFEKMKELLQSRPENLIAIGECGVDYARLKWSPKRLQLDIFDRHFELTQLSKLPMFLHMRECGPDFLSILKKNRESFCGGVVHSFTGTAEEAKEILEFSEDTFIGLNGCSLREANSLDVVKDLPIDRIMIESDAPWCEMRPTHASAPFLTDFSWSIGRPVYKEKYHESLPVRGRNEPSETRRVLHVMSRIKEISEEDLAEQIYQNTISLFPQLQ